jgi:hypothetical protein
LVSAEQGEQETYRVIALGRGGTEVLLVPNGEDHLLPWVEIPRWQRVAENLTAAFKGDWGEEIICLFEPAVESPAISSTRYQLAEQLSSCGNPKLPTRWITLSALYQESTQDPRDYAAIKKAAAVCNGVIQAADTGPFVRLGWFGELRYWIESVTERMGFHVKDEFHQLNASESFSLIRFETDGPAVWFKAVGEPNQREFALTCTLVQLFPDYLPRMLATRPDWNGWLSTEVQGELLAEATEQTTWEKAADALARVQIRSIDRGAPILCAGAHDLGLAALSRLIQPFTSVVAQLMEGQRKVPPPVLDRRDLLALSDSLQSALDASEATGIPEALGHLDLNPGNIIVSENRCAFLDWAEAYVGNPLFSLEYLLQHARRAFGENSDVRTKMIEAYCAPWHRVVLPAAIADALIFAPLLAVFAHAVGNAAWKQPEKLQDPATAGYLRSLARRMDREAKELAGRRPVCLQ